MTMIAHFAAFNRHNHSIPDWLEVRLESPVPPGWEPLVASHVRYVATLLIPPAWRTHVVLHVWVQRGSLRTLWDAGPDFPAATAAGIWGAQQAFTRLAATRCAQCGRGIPRELQDGAQVNERLPHCDAHVASPERVVSDPPALSRCCTSQRASTIFEMGDDVASRTADGAAADDPSEIGASPVFRDSAAAGVSQTRQGVPSESVTRHRLYDVALVKAVGKRLVRDASGREDRERVQQIIERLVRAGGDRPWAFPPDGGSAVCTGLLEHFPNFADVVKRVIRPAFQIGGLNGKLRMPPILLEGPPSVGKTVFAHALAQALHTPYLRIDMAVEQSNATLAGSSTFWANSQPGRLYPLLAFGSPDDVRPATANPVVVIDEVEKASADRYDPLAPLYTLLETETASKFEDLSLPGIRFDASQVLWIFTANRGDLLPEPILSRVQRFVIRPHTPQELRRIAQRMVGDMLADYGPLAGLPVDQEVYEELAVRSPRQMRIAILAALGEAAGRGMDRLGVGDLPPLDATTATHRMGFL